MRFMKTHFHILLFAGFWMSLALQGLVAPPERVLLLESSIVTVGWHLTALAAFLGAPVIALYAWRMRAR